MLQGSFLRGSVHWVMLDPAVGTEAKKKRPAVIISNNIQNRLNKRFVIAPITSNHEKVYPFEVLLVVQGKSNKAMLDQIRTVDLTRLDGFICNLSNKEMFEIDKAIKLVLALS